MAPEYQLLTIFLNEIQNINLQFCYSLFLIPIFIIKNYQAFYIVEM